MTADTALRLAADLLWTGLWLVLPVLGLTMLAGVAISVLQVVTQIQDAALAFVPKLVVAGASLLLFGPWMLQALCRFCVQLWSRIPTVA